MIFISDESYAEIALRLFDQLKDNTSYFNGRIEYDTDAYYSTLTCTAIVYRGGTCPEEPAWNTVEKVVPVWWDFSTCADGTLRPNDFSWTEFSAFFPCHG